jgi:hypothetical protein
LLLSVSLLSATLASVALAADPVPLRVVSDPNPNFHSVWVDALNNELFVTDDNNHALLVYSRTASGAAVPLREIRGLATGLDFPSSTVVDVANNEVWATMNDTSDRATVYQRSEVGNSMPIRIIDFRSTLERRGYAMSVDADSDEVAVSFQRGPSIVVFNRLTGDPLRTIKGPATTLADPHGIFIDAVNGEIVAANEGHVFGEAPRDPSIAVFGKLANGDVAPVRTIQGPLTGLSAPKNLFVDIKNNEIAVANGFDAESITIYSRTDQGDVPPVRTIRGPLTGLNNPSGVFIDTVNDEIAVANWGNHSITVYPRLGNGNVAPLRVIASAPPGSAHVGIGNPGAVAIDIRNDEFAVTNCVSHPRIAFFDRLADGQAGPARVIEGKNTRLSRSLHGIAIDAVNDEVLVPSTMEDSVLVFSRFASGNVVPQRVIQGPLTRISQVQGLDVDTIHNEIAVVNERTRSITIYDRRAEGNVAPLRIISDATGRMARPVGISIDPVNDEIVLTDDARAGEESVQIYPRLANGPTKPLREIRGPSTLLDRVRQVTVDTDNNEIIVASQGNRAVDPPQFGAVVVFDRLADGDAVPKRFIRHVSRSGVRHPRAVWVDAVNDEIGAGDSKGNNVRVFLRSF